MNRGDYTYLPCLLLGNKLAQSSPEDHIVCDVTQYTDTTLSARGLYLGHDINIATYT